MGFSNLNSLLGRVLARRGWAYQVEAALAVDAFQLVIEELWPGKMTGRAKALYLKNHDLTVAVVAPLLAQELRFKEAQVIKAINQRVGHAAVRRLKFIN